MENLSHQAKCRQGLRRGTFNSQIPKEKKSQTIVKTLTKNKVFFLDFVIEKCLTNLYLSHLQLFPLACPSTPIISILEILVQSQAHSSL